MVDKNDMDVELFNLTDDELKKINYYCCKEHLSELKELIRKKLKNKFVRIMRLNINKYLNQINNMSNVKKETVNLLIQSNQTLINVQKLIKNKSIVDANTLLRASFENLIMSMMINYDENIYNEFLNLSIDDETRQYTKPQYLRNNFRKILRKIDGDLFVDISNRKLKEMLDEYYDKLCLFTHSTLIVNAMVELKKEEDLDIYIFALKQNAYFLEIILYLCLKYLTNSNKQPINILYIIAGWIILLTDIDKNTLTMENIDKLKDILYIDINKSYFDKNKDMIELLKNEFEEMKLDLETNPIVVIKFMKEIIL